MQHGLCPVDDVGLEDVDAAVNAVAGIVAGLMVVNRLPGLDSSEPVGMVA